MPITVSGLHLYPVKSLRGISPNRWSLDHLGLANDRRWMLVDADGRFVTQRRNPRLCLIDTALEGQAIILGTAEFPTLHVVPPGTDAPVVEVQVWADRVAARDAGDRAADWLSGFLGKPVRLVYFPPDALRGVDPAYAERGDRTAFSDGFPLLLISEASLRDLNGRLDEPLPMRRFRPNLVVGGTEPYAEDGWRRIRIGRLTLRVVKPCSRCVITTIDPETATTGREPLRTLSQYRRRGNKVYFGQNLIHDGTGLLAVGDEVQVLESTDT